MMLVVYFTVVAALLTRPATAFVGPDRSDQKCWRRSRARPTAAPITFPLPAIRRRRHNNKNNKRSIGIVALKSSIEPEHETDYSTEETLLCLRLSLQPDVSIKDAKTRVSKYSQSFPFSAVLPVQPLMYLPTPDGGVEIRFLRKKTELKSGVDGGIRFFITETTASSSSPAAAKEEGGERRGAELEITAKRNSVGQTVAKMFAERLVVAAYIAGITGEEGESTQKRFGDPPTDVVQVKSVFHKWMS